MVVWIFVLTFFFNNQGRYKNPTVSQCYINHRLGLDEKNLSKFSVYPNPFQAKISISGLENENYKVTIFDNVGKTILAQNLTSNEIDLSTFKAGIYFMTIQTQGKNYAETLKIVKY
ncbi:MAG TPA: T9SS type A sorting domain-containing protein [Crocinitomicaceae bacterium]|nr:T9SS type A sorting domain-containing protein [Crocinitomicaceae bacterium]